MNKDTDIRNEPFVQCFIPIGTDARLVTLPSICMLHSPKILYHLVRLIYLNSDGE